jgi:hypothetical protein
MFSSSLLILNPNEPLESQYPMIPLLLSFRLLVELFLGSAGGRKAFAFSVPCPRFDCRFSASRPSVTEFLPLNGVTWTHQREHISLPANWKMCSPLQCRPHLNHSNQFDSFKQLQRTKWLEHNSKSWTLTSFPELTQEGSGSRNDRSFSAHLNFKCPNYSILLSNAGSHWLVTFRFKPVKNVPVNLARDEHVLRQSLVPSVSR